MKDLYNINFKCPKIDIDKYIRKEKNTSCSWTGKINMMKVNILQRYLVLQCNVNHSSMSYFTKIENVS